MSWDAVKRWRDDLRTSALSIDVGVSPEGLALVLGDALDALSDDALDQAAAYPGTAWEEAVFVAARTVVTAPIEWCALLLGRGSRVVLKSPSVSPGLAHAMADAAARHRLPLTVRSDHAAVNRGHAVFAMGSDASIATIQSTLAPHQTFFGFGSRTSVAWWSSASAADAAAAGIARDLAAHDSRGCMTPALVYTDAPASVWRPALSAALDAAESQWPRGHLTPIEHAELRARDALATAAGERVAGSRWRIHRLPSRIAEPAALPRAVTVVEVDSMDAALRHASQWAPKLSTIGVSNPGAHSGAWASVAPAARVCALGEMQRPPLIRRHDGVSTVRATACKDDTAD